LNTILTQLLSNVLSTYFYDIKVVQTLYPTSHKLNVRPYGFKFLLQNILNLLSCVHIKTLGKLLFLFTLPCQHPISSQKNNVDTLHQNLADTFTHLTKFVIIKDTLD